MRYLAIFGATAGNFFGGARGAVRASASFETWGGDFFEREKTANCEVGWEFEAGGRNSGADFGFFGGAAGGENYDRGVGLFSAGVGKKCEFGGAKIEENFGETRAKRPSRGEQGGGFVDGVVAS